MPKNCLVLCGGEPSLYARIGPNSFLFFLSRGDYLCLSFKEIIIRRCQSLFEKNHYSHVYSRQCRGNCVVQRFFPSRSHQITFAGLKALCIPRSYLSVKMSGKDIYISSIQRKVKRACAAQRGALEEAGLARALRDKCILHTERGQQALKTRGVALTTSIARQRGSGKLLGLKGRVEWGRKYR